MRALLIIALGATGCASLECGSGTEEVDGVCVAVEADTDTDTDTDEEVDIEDLLDTLPECEPVEANGRIDLTTGCADGGCAAMTADELNTALGEDGSCTPSSVDSTRLFCDWSMGIWTTFDDLDQNGEPDADSTAGTLYLEYPYDGGTDDGLGPDASFSCFVDVLGYPNSIDFWDLSGTLEPYAMFWFDLGLYVSDFWGTGTAETMGISGADVR
jgi:hypothetical protein